MNNIVLLCVGLLVILYGALSMNVSMTRLRRRKDPSMTEATFTKAVRAHGNASEYIPLFVALLLYFNTVRPGAFANAMAIIILASRALHAAGMFVAPTVNDRNALKFIGALGTYVSLFVLGVSLLLQWLKI